MSQAYEGQDPMVLAQQAERDLNSEWAKNEHKVSDTARHAAGASDSSTSSITAMNKTPLHEKLSLLTPLFLQLPNPASTSPSSRSSPARA